MQHGILPFLELVSSPPFWKSHIIIWFARLHVCQNITFYHQNNNQNLTPLTAYESNLSAITIVKKIIVYYEMNWLLHITKIVCERLGSGCYERFRNHFNVIFTHAICCISRVYSLLRLIFSGRVRHEWGSPRKAWLHTVSLRILK